MNFKLINCGFFDSKIAFGNIKESKERKVEYYELELFPTDGELSFVGNKKKAITHGTLLFAKPNEIRHSVFPFKAFYVRFEICTPEFAEILNNVETFNDASHMYKKILKCMHDIIDASRISNIDNPILECKMHKLIDELLIINSESNTNQKLYESCSEIIIDAINFINNHYHEKLSINSIAHFIHLSPIYFHGLFKRETGTTPYEYITKKRIDHAIILLETSDKKISTISSECGFSSQSYFSATFKKTFGCTPKEYRRAYCEKYIIYNPKKL